MPIEHREDFNTSHEHVETKPFSQSRAKQLSLTPEKGALRDVPSFPFSQKLIPKSEAGRMVQKI